MPSSVIIVFHMTHAKEVVIAASVAVFVLLLVLPSLAVPADAAAVLDRPQTAAVQAGTVLQVDARGEGSANASGGIVRALTSMSLVFELSERGPRGASFRVMSGSFALNSTDFVITGGTGVAGRPEMGRLNGTIVFLFHFNMTGPNDTITEVALLGIVLRPQGRAPVLAMRVTMSIDGLSWLVRQSGRIHIVSK